MPETRCAPVEEGSGPMDRVLPLWQLLGGSILLGAAIAAALVGWGFLSGQSARAWFPTGDQNQALVGLLYYLHDEWRLPLLMAENLGPSGMNIAFTDSIPLLALPAKIWFSVTGQVVNYFGAWVLLCFVLQAVAFNLLLRQFGHATLITLVAGTLIACTAPLLMIRYWMEHLALMGHFLVLLGLLLVLREGRKQIRPGRILVWWLPLLTVALWVHPYFLALTAALFVTARIERALSDRRLGAESIRTLLGLIWILGVMLISGHISLGGLPTSAASDTSYTMNLLAPLLAQGLSGLFPGWGHADPTGRQAVEGFVYFGAGIWAALILSGALGLWRWLRPPGRATLPARHQATDIGLSGWLLVVLALGLFIYAVSPEVYALDRRLFDYSWPPPLEALARHFRVTSRFFWPVFYLAYLVALIGLLAWLPKRLAAPALVAIAALQWIDTQPLRAHLQARSSELAHLSSDARWRELVPLHDELLLYPPMFCTPDEAGMALSFDLQLLAAHHQLRTNSLYAARWKPDCVGAVRDSYQTTLVPGRLIVFQRPPYGRGQLARMAAPPSACRAFEHGYACSLEWTALPPATRQSWEAAPADIPSYDPGRPLHLISGSEDIAYLDTAWALSEHWGTWSLGRHARLTLPLEQPMSGKGLAEFEVQTLLSEGLRSQRVTVSLNETRLTEWRFTLEQPGGWRRLELPADLVAGARVLTFEFLIADPRSPAELGLNANDTRLLGMALIRARVQDTPPAGSP